MTPAAAAAQALHARSLALNIKYGLSKKRNPNGTLAGAKVGGAAAPKVRVSAAPPTMAQQAAQTAAAAIDPAKAAVNEQVATMEAARIAHQNAVAGVAKALAGLTAGDAGLTRDGYQQAADRVASYASGLTGSLRDTQTEAAGKVATLMHALNIDSTGAASTAGDNANVANLVGGVMPASSLAEAGAASLTTEANQRNAAAARLGDDASQADYTAGQNIEKVRAQLEDIEAKRPGLIQDALDHLAQQANAKRATDTQIGYLQLQQAKTASDQALAWTNITGTVHVVGKNGKIVDTGKPASGSDAATIAAQTARNNADNATSRANAKLSASTRAQVAQASADATRYAADQSAKAKAAAAVTAAEGKKAAARISAQKAAGGKAPTASQQATVIKGATASGSTVVSGWISRIKSQIPNTYPQQKGEDPAKFEKRKAEAIATFRKWARIRRPQILTNVIQSITPQLLVIGYKPDEIRALANAIVNAQIPA